MRTNVHTLSVWEMHHAGLKKHIKGKGKMIRGFLLCVYALNLTVMTFWNGNNLYGNFTQSLFLGLFFMIPYPSPLS